MLIAAEIFGRELIEETGVATLVSSLILNLWALIVVVAVLYYPQSRDRDHAFMMVTLNVVVFLVAFFMNSVELGVGFGFGLFALFGIVRYRTESIPVQEMSYLFAVIALGLINSVGITEMSWTELAVANGAMLITLAVLVVVLLRRPHFRRNVVYDRVDFIRPDKRSELLWDLWERTGLEIIDIEVRSVNFLNDTAQLQLTCKKDPLVSETNSASQSLPAANASVFVPQRASQTPG